MDDEELVRDFIRVLSVDGETQVHVGVVQWDGSHEPRCEWECARCTPLASSEAVIDGIVREVLESAQYFAVCEECGERNPLGWMDDDSICQSCAEQNHGTVY